ncbi:MAG: ATPase P [Tissierellia bacterium]|nr:ATPase P [Tissierellia bacterium]
MIEIKIPGRAEYKIENIVFDYNGTIAADGRINPSVREKLATLCKMAKVYVLTADTYGSAEKECQGLDLTLKTFPKDNAGDHKAEIVRGLGGMNTVCFGNGYNDVKMFQVGILSIAVLESEGMYAGLLNKADVLVRTIDDGLNLLLNTNAMVATLRA